MNKNQKTFSGFTLIELLVALGVFSVVMVMVTTGFRSVLDLKKRLQSRSEQVHQLQFAMLLIQRDLTQIIQGYREGSEPALSYDPSGTLQFVRGGIPNPGARHQRGSLQRIHYAILENTLVRTVFTVAEIPGIPEIQPTERTILNNVESFKARFWTHQKTWVDQWPLEEKANEEGRESNDFLTLPKAIMFTLNVRGMGEVSRVFYLPVGDYYAKK